MDMVISSLWKNKATNISFLTQSQRVLLSPHKLSHTFNAQCQDLLLQSWKKQQHRMKRTLSEHGINFIGKKLLREFAVLPG